MEYFKENLIASLAAVCMLLFFALLVPPAIWVAKEWFNFWLM